jgi:hypothetical protein
MISRIREELFNLWYTTYSVLIERYRDLTGRGCSVWWCAMDKNHRGPHNSSKV